METCYYDSSWWFILSTWQDLDHLGDKPLALSVGVSRLGWGRKTSPNCRWSIPWACVPGWCCGLNMKWPSLLLVFKYLVLWLLFGEVVRPLKGRMLLEEEGHWGQALSSCLHSTPDWIQCGQHLLPSCFSYRDGVYLPSNCKPQQALLPLSSCKVFCFFF